MNIETNFDPFFQLSFCNKVNIAFDCGVLLAILSRILIIFSGIPELTIFVAGNLQNIRYLGKSYERRCRLLRTASFYLY